MEGRRLLKRKKFSKNIMLLKICMIQKHTDHGTPVMTAHSPVQRMRCFWQLGWLIILGSLCLNSLTIFSNHPFYYSQNCLFFKIIILDSVTAEMKLRDSLQPKYLFCMCFWSCGGYEALWCGKYRKKNPKTVFLDNLELNGHISFLRILNSVCIMLPCYQHMSNLRRFS